MSLTIRVGRKYAVYLPKRVAESLGINEGDMLLLRIECGAIVLKPLKRPPSSAEPWGRVKPEEVEEIGEEVSDLS